MKNAALFVFTLFTLVSCSHVKTDPSDPMTPALSVESDKKTKPKIKSGAIFHVVGPLGVKLVLINVEKHKEEIFLMDKTLSQLDLPPGFWQISGFILNGKRHKIMNNSKKFIFHLKKDEMTYAGSYIFQCPKVDHTHIGEMKKMSFFNRYPFSSETGVCELVVGSDFINVNRVWKELDKDQHRSLKLGF